MAPVYQTIKTQLGEDGVLLAYGDDVYLVAPPTLVARVLRLAGPLYELIGLTIGWGVPTRPSLA